MSLYFDAKKETHRAACCVSRGASITLVSGTFGYTALFDHANKVSAILGQPRNLKETADGIYESVPQFTIPTDEMPDTCTKLSQGHSIALVECMFDEKKGSRFALVWFIRAIPVAVKPIIDPLDEF